MLIGLKLIETLMQARAELVLGGGVERWHVPLPFQKYKIKKKHIIRLNINT